jgi:hypothetical protein
LFTKNDKGLLLNEAQILGPDYTEKLNADFTTQVTRKFILRMKNNRVTGCDSIPAEAWQILAITDEGIKILMKLFNMTTNKTEFPKE